MKLRILLLVGFTVLNSVLIAAFVVKPSLAPPSIRKHLPTTDSALDRAPSAQRITATPSAIASKENPGGAEAVWEALHSNDLATLVRRLREAGFPATVVRAIVDAEVERQFSPRIKELMRTVTETPYWRQDPGYYTGNAKLFESINQIYRERSRVLRDLLGNDAYAYSGVDPTAAQRRQYGNLSQGKIDLVQRISDDYAEMTGQIRSAMQGITLPEDREKLALLDREKRADLAAILTPEELADYEMRTSPVTMRLRTALSIMDATEGEFRAIYQAHDPFKDILYPTSSGGMTVMTRETMDTRRETTKQINEQLKATLDEARFAQYQRATDTDFQQLYRLGQRDGISYETLVRAHDVRTPTAEASMKILDDRSLSPDAKRTALKELAQTARTTLLSTLGPTTGPTYVESSRWLTSLDQGRGVSIGPDGSFSTRSVPMTPPPGGPTPKR